MAKITINEERCKGCGLCIEACPRKIIVFDQEKVNQKGYHFAQCKDDSQCIGCASCGMMCPDMAITVER